METFLPPSCRDPIAGVAVPAPVVVVAVASLVTVALVFVSVEKTPAVVAATASDEKTSASEEVAVVSATAAVVPLLDATTPPCLGHPAVEWTKKMQPLSPSLQPPSIPDYRGFSRSFLISLFPLVLMSWTLALDS